VAGARVRAEMAWGHAGAVRTEADGRFVVERLDGPVEVRVRHPELQDGSSGEVEPGSAPITIELSPGGAVEGLVLGRDGRPLPGAQVGSEHGRRTLTGADGRYRLAGLPEGRTTLVKVDVPGTYRRYERATVDVVAGATAEHDFGTGTRVLGRLTHDGKPAPAAKLALARVPLLADGEHCEHAELQAKSARSDEGGRFTFTGVRPGLHVLTVLWNGRRFGLDVEVPEGASEVPLDVAVPELELSGRVLDVETGEPIGGVHVGAQRASEPRADGRKRSSHEMAMSTNGDELRLSTQPKSTDVSHEDGSFRLLLPETGAWTVFASAPNWRQVSPSGRVEVSASTHVVIELERQPTQVPVRVTVRDIENVPAVLNAAIDAGATNIYGLNFAIEDSDALASEARAEALDDARQRAGELAGLAEVELGDIISIVEIQGGFDPFNQTALEARGLGGGGGAAIEPGQLSVNVQLRVTFRIGG